MTYRFYSVSRQTILLVKGRPLCTKGLIYFYSCKKVGGLKPPPPAPPSARSLYSCEMSVSRKPPCTSHQLRHFHLLLQQLFIPFPLYYLLSIAYGRLKTKENFKLLALKVIAVAHERCLLTRGSKYSNLTWKLLVF